MEQKLRYMGRIGIGSFGEVHKAKWNGQLVAVKKLHDYLLDYDPGDLKSDRATFEAECKMLQRLRHKNIVQMLDFIISHTSPPVLITELLDCDLAHYIGRLSPSKIPFTETVSIMQDVAEGLAYLHQRDPPIVHRDLASKNVLLTKERQAKIADLGLAKVFPSRGKEYASPIPGTPVYAAPDTYPESMALTAGALRRAEYSVKIDLFSFGVMLMEVITARSPRPEPMWPFTEDGQPIPEYKRRSQDINEMGEHKLAGLVLQCLQNSSSERPSAGEVAARLQQEMGKIQQKQRIAQHKKSPRLKILLIGSAGVGKTCIAERFLNPAFDCFYVDPTIGGQPYVSSINVNERTFQLYIQDTAGQERFGSIPPALLRNSDGVLLVFDVTKYATLAEIPRVMQLVKENSSSQPSMVLVGNKADMPGHKVSRESAEKFAEHLGIPYVETSAISRLNIEQVFETIVGQIYSDLDLSDIDTYMISDGSIRNLRENDGPRESLCNRFTNWFKSWF